LIVALASSGCSLGFGSAYVGQWREHDEVEFKTCIEDDAGRCTSEKETVKHVPERAYWGVIVPYAAMGASWVSREGATTPRFRIEPSMEILRGRGRWAYGVRVGGVFDILEASSLPLMVLGHYSLTERLSLHAGGGYIPIAGRFSERSNVGARGLVGFQWALGRVRTETYWVLSGEADTMWIDFDRSYRSTGFTVHFGPFF
jgi:hypothetical protein